MFADARRAALRPQSSHQQHGLDHGDRDSFPGDTGVRPNSVAPLAEMLRLNGYATAAFGKSHETPVWELSASGPTDRWPTRSGFDKFYGFIGGETDQWAPTVWDGMNKVQIEEKPGYHFMTDMTDQAIEWVQSEKSLTPDKPFFIYFAPGATHAPHHVAEGMDRQIQGQVRSGLGQAARGDIATAEEARRRPRRHEARAEA